MPSPSSYKPTGRKRGRPKGYSPIKARQQAAELLMADQEGVVEEQDIAPEKYQLVQLGVSTGVNYISQKLVQKKPAFSLKRAALKLLGSR